MFAIGHPNDNIWTYTTGGDVNKVAISADGEHITAGTSSTWVYSFDKEHIHELHRHEDTG